MRFTTKQVGDGVWVVIDNENVKWNMPHKAVSLSLYHDGATKIAAILNQSWQEFLNNPE